MRSFTILFFRLSLPFFLFLFSSTASAQRNVTSVIMDGHVIKKKPIIDSLAEWMSKSDLRKADTCLQMLFNAIHDKDTLSERVAIMRLEVIRGSKKYEGDQIAMKALSCGTFYCCIFKKRCEEEKKEPPPTKIQK